MTSRWKVDFEVFRPEKALTAIAVTWAISLHIRCFVSAGALWRDEANSILHARMGSWGDLWRTLRYDSFPAMYPVLLRTWSLISGTYSDEGLRLFGLLTGLAVLASILAASRLIGLKTPIVLLVLFAMDPILIAEGDSIRPYGWSLICLIWAFALVGRHLLNPGNAVLAAASMASVLAVQVSYTNCIFIGAASTCGILVAALACGQKRLWRYLIPAATAALSLIPYRTTILFAREWAAVLHSDIEWLPFLHRYVSGHSVVTPIVWAGFLVLAFVAFIFKRGGDRGQTKLAAPIPYYALSMALMGVVGQIGFVVVSGIPPFPRYFLASAMFGAFALEAMVSTKRIPKRAAAVLLALLVTAGPAWSWLSQRHTDADRICAVLNRESKCADLIVISPWFLHPSLQRYYSGQAKWITVPILDHFPMMRYDLIRRAMLADDRGEGLDGRIEAALASGGSIWFVSQRKWSNLNREEAPDYPELSNPPRGVDYIRFRSFWERLIEQRLHSCCLLVKNISDDRSPIWEEEDLLLTIWHKREGRMPSNELRLPAAEGK